MISQIAIENFIIIDHLDIDFTQGFTSITGETGTGKSIILDAINFCFGKFSTKSLRRDLEKDCFVEIRFAFDSLEIPGFKELSNIIIKKIIDKNDKASYFLNNTKTSSKTLKDMMPYLLDITAQSESILSKSSQAEILDNFLLSIDKEFSHKLFDISSLFSKISNIDREILKTQEDMRISKRDKVFNTQIVEELSPLEIKENEETELLERRTKLSRLCSNNNLLKNSFDALTLPQSQIIQAEKNLERINSEITDSLKTRLESISLELSDISSELEELAYASRSMEEELTEIDDRISILRSLARKYNTSSGTLYEFLNETLKKLEISESFETKLSSLIASRESLINSYNLLADDLHMARLKASSIISERICSKLNELLMPNASFKIEVIKNDHIMNQFGKDSIEFLANFNKDSFLMPLAQIASGGEAARLNFALKTVFGTVGNIKTIIFDEVDIGIGGAAAYSMGNAMRTLANDFNIQVIAITHSPQVAARADSHILIKKENSKNNLKISASKLTPFEKINEIARMISGDVITPDAQLAAKQLLQRE